MWSGNWTSLQPHLSPLLPSFYDGFVSQSRTGKLFLPQCPCTNYSHYLESSLVIHGYSLSLVRSQLNCSLPALSKTVAPSLFYLIILFISFTGLIITCNYLIGIFVDLFITGSLHQDLSSASSGAFYLVIVLAKCLAHCLAYVKYSKTTC